MLRHPLLLLFLPLIAGCATARMVEVEPGVGGVIAVFPPQDLDARAKANQLMLNNCGGGQFRVVSEGEVVVGQITTSDASRTKDKERTWDGKSETETATATTQTQNQTEWRITYRCAAAPMPAAYPPPGYPPPR
jgi:hypothetical protein